MDKKLIIISCIIYFLIGLGVGYLLGSTKQTPIAGQWDAANTTWNQLK